MTGGGLGVRLLGGSILAMAALSALLYWNSRGGAAKPLIVYCAAALQPAVEEIGRSFGAETGTAVQATYGASQVLLAKLELTKDGDIFIPADDEYLRLATEKGLVYSRTPLTKLRPVVAVAGGNPLGIANLSDLLKPAVRLSLPNPDTAAIGRVVRTAIPDQWPALSGRARVIRITVGDVAADVRLGVADAGFVWDETVRQFPTLAAVELAEFAKIEAEVSAAVLTTTTRPESALQFARYLVAPDRGGRILTKHGFRQIPGPSWDGPR